MKETVGVVPRVPEELMARFRATAMERLEKIDLAWADLVRGEGTSEVEKQILREVHTLKGDAKVVGLSEASLLCQRLEDLLSAAKSRGYRVHEDVDIVVTMTIQFIAMLVRKRSASKGGIDLHGFLKQIEEVMGEWLRRSSEAPDKKLSVGPHLRIKDHQRVTASSGLRLSSSATAVFLEQLRLSGEAQARIRDVWLSLLDGVLDAHRAPLTPIVYGHTSTARELAEGIGKRVTIAIEGDDLRVGPETSDALGIVLLHALRNAVDHGIELPETREQAGKPKVGTITVRVRSHADSVILTVQDDGAGIDLESVRKKAVERGLVSADVAPHAPDAQVLEYLFATGLSTRESTSELSGRGIGLDAAHAAVLGAAGNMTIETRRGQGTTVRASIPDARGAMEVISFRGAHGTVTFAVPAPFSVRRVERVPDLVLEDLFKLPGESAAPTIALEIAGEGISFVVAASSKPLACQVLRRCPTPPEDLVEIAWREKDEMVVLRPEVVHARLEKRN